MLSSYRGNSGASAPQASDQPILVTFAAGYILPPVSGGTGVNGSAAANGTLLIGNGAGYTLATLTAGTGITITNGAGSIQIAASGGVTSFVDNETPTGVIDGVNAVFALAANPNPDASLQLFKTDIGTAVLMIAGIHYNLVGQTITFTAGNIPQVGETMRCWYRT